jgi:murein DD-endopeptidase MepM/ murein hydrolase activator NlpD|tara:strand:- start:217 stop:1476 length:1260 start_codon:yes stop_codon:yes gene_type:complete
MLKTRRLIILLLILFFIFTFYLIKNFSNKNVYNLEAVADEINLSQNIPKDEISLSIEYVYEDLVVIENGQTFGELIKSYDIPDAEKYTISQLLNNKIDLTRLDIGTEIRITYLRKTDFVEIKKISILDKKNNQIQIIKNNGEYETESASILTFTKNILKEVTINESLYRSAINSDVPPNIIMQFVNLYGFDVDFQREIRNGNKIKIYYEVFLDSKLNIRKAGNIKFASLSLSKNTYELYKYTTKDNNKFEFFNSTGKSAVKALMKTPINGARLSSGYGLRKHPILGYDRLHQGVDFAAPTGTPIMAAGTGFIEKIGMNGGAGNYIKIKHINGYKTAYGHMSKFASGLKKGSKVTQGQTIGFVGSTGMSTGPHLHYEVIFNNKKINPMKMKLPSGRKLKGKILDDFISYTNSLNREMELN